MPLLQSEPVLALGYDQLNSGDVGTEAGHVTRKECQAFRGRVSADVKVWQRRPSLAAASEGWEGWKDGRMEGWKDGRMEGWKDGRMEGWKDGRMEGWKDGRMEGAATP